MEAHHSVKSLKVHVMGVSACSRTRVKVGDRTRVKVGDRILCSE